MPKTVCVKAITVLNALDCKGPNISPPLEWTHAPAGARSFAMDDYEARGGYGSLTGLRGH